MDRILVNTVPHPDSMRYLEEHGFEYVIVPEEDPPASYREAPECVGVVANASLPFDDAFFELAPKVRVVGRVGVGYDNVDLDAAGRRGVRIVNTPLPIVEPVAEHAIMLFLALVRAVIPGDRDARAARFRQPENNPGPELRGKTLGIIGLGRTGQRVAEVARRGFEMNILYADQVARTDIEEQLGASHVELDELLRRSDFVSIHVNLSASTQGLIDARALSLMKSTAYLVNVARGPVVDEAALVDALKANVIAGAGIDVYEVEPPTDDNPLWSLPNVVVTPHRAGFSEESRYGCSMVVEDIVRVLRGEEPEFPVS
jgi:phosphoglycerate dehydrogenase-like enzyme